MFRRFILSRLIWIVYRLLTWSWRVKVIEGPDLHEAIKSGRPVIFAHWHGDELAIIHLVTRYRIATMTSTSSDGQLVDYVIRKLGGATSKGSSTRGAVGALKGLVRLCRAGYNASMAVDGPKGPLHVVKPGVFELARLTDALIVPMGVACARIHRFERSWNKAILPLPFARLHVFMAPGLTVSREMDLKSLELQTELATRLKAAAQTAHSHCFAASP